MNKKIAIITGANSGIGKAVALDLASQNYHVILIARSIERLKKVKSEIESFSGSASYYSLDVSNSQEVESCFNDIINQYHHIDVLFNNAGIVRLGTANIQTNDIDAMIKTNLLGAIYIGNAVASIMKNQKSGYIINIASMAGKRALPVNGIYSASKYGLVGYGEALFKELLPYGIKVTTICPSMVATDMTKDLKIPSELMIQPADIVQTVRYLLSIGKTSSIQEILVQCTEFSTKEIQAVTEKFF